MKKFACTLITLLSLTNLFAQSIQGYIVDSSNNPIAYANVVLLTLPDSTFHKGSISNDNGLFTIDGTNKGNYLIRFSYLGYKDYSQNITCKGKDLNLGYIKLEEESTSLSEVMVTANRLRVYSKGGSIVTDIANSS